MKTNFFHGIVAGVFSSAACIVFNYAYSSAMFVDFSLVINSVSIIGACMFGCVLASLGFLWFSRWVRKGTDVWFNLIFLLLIFGSFVSSFSMELPFEIDAPELFVGLSIPMHIFPALFWIATKPLFYRSQPNLS